MVFERKIVFFAKLINEDFHHPIAVSEHLQDSLPGV